MDLENMTVSELARIVDQYGLTEIEISKGDMKVLLKRQVVLQEARIASGQAVQASPASAIPPQRKPVPDFSHITEVKALRDELATAREGLAVKGNDVPKGAAISERKVDGACVKAPLAGVFYRQPRPGEPPYAEVGQHVKKGDIVCLVEAMKMINEIAAGCDGVIKEFLVANETFVEFGSPLVVLEED